MTRQEPINRVIIIVGATSVVLIFLFLLLQEPYQATNLGTANPWKYNLWQSGNYAPTPRGNDTTTAKEDVTPTPKKYDAPTAKKNGTAVNLMYEEDDLDEEEVMKLYLRRLVGGENRTHLEESGIKCLFDQHFEQCIIEKPVIITAKKPLTVYVPSNHVQENYTVRPYARRDDETAINLVTPVHIVHGNVTLPSTSCDVTHNVPAMIFSIGGYSENMFHRTNEISIPLFLTSRHFESKLQFIVTDYSTWWMERYQHMLQHLSFGEVLNGDADERVHCFPGAVVGLRYHDNLAINDYEIPKGYTMTDFRHFLAQVYNLAMYAPLRPNNKPKVFLLSRQGSRAFVNEDEMVQMMEKMGFIVRKALAGEMGNTQKFSQVVNSHDILLGVHGAGFTNEIYLRNGAVVIQVVPFNLEWASEYYYGRPAQEMGLNYMEYKIELKESSLYGQYGPDDPVIRDPGNFVRQKGYGAAFAAYHGQNVTVDLGRFWATLVEALKHLGYPTP